MLGWLFAPVSRQRVVVLRWLVYAFVVIDVLWWHTSGEYHGDIATRWYQPLVVGQLLPLPEPTYAVVQTVKWASVALALAALSGRAPRLFGWSVAALWFEYQVIAFSYGKVDHDRWALLVALVVLPTAGRIRLRDDRCDEAAGWAIRCVQLACVATYFLAACAKLRFGGPEWVNSATVARSVVRRGTVLSHPLLSVPWVLVLTQWGIMIMELSAPGIFLLARRWQQRLVAAWLSFHAVTYAMVTIIFLPHILCLTAFLPLERLLLPRRALPRRLWVRNAAETRDPDPKLTVFPEPVTPSAPLPASSRRRSSTRSTRSPSRLERRRDR